MKVETHNGAASYTALLWITGAPVATDAAPTNLASVAVTRRISAPANLFVTPGLAIVAFAADGSSTCVGRFWWYDSAQDLWVPNGTTVTLTTASTNSGLATVGCMPGCLHHFQVTANAGGTTKIGVTLR
jgi:hypothetical protein